MPAMLDYFKLCTLVFQVFRQASGHECAPTDNICALAKALDVIGDRWTLLIVRELLIRGACRYTDLRNGLPGIATNLLAERLRELEEAGIVAARGGAAAGRVDAVPSDAARRCVGRRSWNRSARWGAPLLAAAPKSDVYCGHWIAMPARHLRDHAPDQPPMRIELRAGDEPVTVEVANGSVRTRCGAAENPDAVMTGMPRLMSAVLRGEIDLAKARARWAALRGRCPGAVPAAAACRRSRPPIPNDQTPEITMTTTVSMAPRLGWRTPIVILLCGCLIGMLGFGARSGSGLLPDADVAGERLGPRRVLARAGDPDAAVGRGAAVRRRDRRSLRSGARAERGRGPLCARSRRHGLCEHARHAASHRRRDHRLRARGLVVHDRDRRVRQADAAVVAHASRSAPARRPVRSGSSCSRRSRSR